MEPLLANFNLDTVWTLLKWVYVFVFGLYIIFALVVYSQIKQMVTTLKGQLDGPIKLVGMIHLLVSVGIFLLAIVIL